MKKYLFIFFLIVGIISALIGGYLFFFLNFTKMHVDKKVSVRLNWVHQAQFAGIYVAKEKGFYAEEGLDVDVREYIQGLDQVKELVGGQVDFIVAGATELLLGVDKGYDVIGLATIYQNSPLAYASRKELGIKTPNDFIGKTLGNGGGGIETLVGYNALLGLHGIDRKLVKLVDLGFDSASDVIDKKADVVALYRTDQTYLVDRAGVGYNLLLPEKFGFDVYGDTLATSQSLIDSDPELVEKFIMATIRGWEYAVNNPDEALDVTSRYDYDIYEDSDYERHILEASIDLIKPIGGRNIGHMEFLKWNRAYRAMIEAGVITGDFNIKYAYTTRFLK